MASKRMFTKKIIDSDAFLDMPLSTQALYFHLNMRADDDGFIGNPKKVMRIIGANSNDLDVLLAKRFLLAFEDGVLVIKHWRMHNTIRQDRYTPTVYTEELKKLTISPNKSYTENAHRGNHLATTWQPNGNQMSPPDIDLDLDLDSELDIDIGINTLAQKNTHFEQFWSAYPRKVGKDRCAKWFKARKITQEFVDDLLKAIAQQKKSVEWTKKDKLGNEGAFIPYPHTWLNRGGWNDELTYSQPYVNTVQRRWENFLKEDKQ